MADPAPPPPPPPPLVCNCHYQPAKGRPPVRIPSGNCPEHGSN
jgi:hypothetical protein